MDIDVAGRVGPERDVLADLARFVRANIRLIAGGLLIPNLLSLLTLTSLVDIGLPPRTESILLYACVAILARHLRFVFIVPLFLAVLAFDLVRTLALMFGMAPSEFLAAVEHAQRVELFASSLYVALIATIAATTIASLVCLSSRAALAAANAPVLFGLALGFAAVDFVGNLSPHYNLGWMIGRSEPVQSAAEVSGFAAAAGEGGRDVVLVMVESLGYLRDPVARARIAAPLRDPALARDYALTSGYTTYFGSTTSGEMRELCGTRMFYKDYVAQDADHCLPDRLAQRGYGTVAVHGFVGGMFEREQWYPTIGFGRSLFGKDLIKATGRICGDSFRGACDADMAPLLAAARPAGARDQPRFVYWLTLNSHVPVAPDQARTNFRCGSDGGSFGQADVCRMAEIWHDVFNVVAQLARDPALRQPEILVVGDHAPPLWSKRGRAQFEPGQVAWYRLQPRGAPQMREAELGSPQ
ncbi:sulfatase-like hydrolase/transferase [Rhodopseudomonas palustris]|uniref:sulfatase-like hydrolase/transferase n=1 Tax=Rhodopseudomonas palustris TaxID=1076 RepID=UPI0020CD90FA|nr:sulfatase-like hydrolase/transferase [Rhodopseudomonas palustris]MCP9629558.1 sulfatase-like hydrolase/transferase [Rhodopseudomonas palustris]